MHKRGQKALMLQAVEVLKVQKLGRVILKVTETVHKRGQKVQQPLAVEALKVLKQL